MSTVKLDIMRDALRRIAMGNSDPDVMVNVATTALADVAAVVEYRITARTWWSRNGGAEFKAELRRTDSGNVVLHREGGSAGWEWAMMKAIKDSGIFEPSDCTVPTIYFREHCKVPYEHAEVSRKRDL